MDEERLQADEYELQYYGFTSTEIIIQFSVCVEHYMKQALKNIETDLLEKNPQDRPIIKAQIADLEKLYQANLKDLIMSVQETVRNIFRIHPNVSLDGDEIYQKEHTAEEMATLRQEVESLEQEFLREKLFLKRCKEHKNIIDKLKPLYESTNEKLKTVPKIIGANSKIEMINLFLKLQKDYLVYCSDDKAGSQAKYYQLRQVFPAKDSGGT